MKVNPIEFKDSHGYEIDGIWYPRVTKIVEIKAKPALYRFYGGMESFEAGEKVKEKSANEGTLIHESIEALLLGKEIDVSESIKPSVDAFMDFVSKKFIKVVPEFVERRLFHPDHRYAGTLDAIAEIDGKVGVLDIKTSQEIYRDYNLQTSAYVAAMEREVPELETRWILRIDQAHPCRKCGSLLRTKGGKEKVRLNWRNGFSKSCVHEWNGMKGFVELKEFPFWQEDFNAFLGAKKLWEWENEDVLKQIGYLL